MSLLSVHTITVQIHKFIDRFLTFFALWPAFGQKGREREKITRLIYFSSKNDVINYYLQQFKFQSAANYYYCTVNVVLKHGICNDNHNEMNKSYYYIVKIIIVMIIIILLHDYLTVMFLNNKIILVHQLMKQLLWSFLCIIKQVTILLL